MLSEMLKWSNVQLKVLVPSGLETGDIFSAFSDDSIASF
jgi:hypothetical protein